MKIKWGEHEAEFDPFDILPILVLFCLPVLGMLTVIVLALCGVFTKGMP